jgi:sugar fermentation stimulation protein A
MKFEQPLQHGVLIKRYKRFLADVELGNGEVTTMHCPNTGSMRHCAEPGFGVWFSSSANPKRKYPFTWELAENDQGHLIGINTNNANKLVKEALINKSIEELVDYSHVASEVKYGDENSRIDFLLTDDRLPDCYVEVKSVTLLEEGLGLFPDAVSTRGQKHLRELENVVKSGGRSVLIYCVQHTGIQQVKPAREIDPEYAAAMESAMKAGVEVLAYGCEISSKHIQISGPLSFALN